MGLTSSLGGRRARWRIRAEIGCENRGDASIQAREFPTSLSEIARQPGLISEPRFRVPLRRLTVTIAEGRHMLFSDRSLWTMLHGLVLSGGALMLLLTALFSLRVMAAPEGAIVPARQSNAFAWVTVAAATLLWLSVLGGTYIVFPMYRATPRGNRIARRVSARAACVERGHALAACVRDGDQGARAVDSGDARDRHGVRRAAPSHNAAGRRLPAACHGFAAGDHDRARVGRCAARCVRQQGCAPLVGRQENRYG